MNPFESPPEPFDDDIEARWFRSEHAEAAPDDTSPPAVTGEQLAAADEAVQAQTSSTSSGVTPCSAAGLPLIVRVTGEDDQPLENVLFELRKSATETLQTRSGSDGVGTFTGIDEGSYTLALPELDEDAWEIASSAKLENPAKSSAAAWQAPPAQPADSGSPHSVVEGECISTLALRYGFHPDTIWNDCGNAALKAKRKDKNILAVGDAVAIPARRIAARAVEAGSRVQLRRKGVPEVVRIRFLDGDGNPRVDVPYLAQLATPDGAEQRSGKTNGEGYVIEKAPASLSRIVITLGTEEEVYEFLPATLDPVETTAGVQDRLLNLGYDCGGEDGQAGPLTQRALREFQRDNGLPETGQADDATRAELTKQHLS